MLIKIALTSGSRLMMRSASITRSTRLTVPMSRKLAGSPPASLIVSIVAIARPAPLTMQPMLPSNFT